MPRDVHPGDGIRSEPWMRLSDDPAVAGVACDPDPAIPGRNFEATGAGYRTFPIELVASSGKAVHGYSGLAVGSDRTRDLCCLLGCDSFNFGMSDRVVAALRAAGAADFCTEAPPEG